MPVKFNFRFFNLLLSGHVYMTVLSPELEKYFLCVFKNGPQSLGTAITIKKGSVHARPVVGAVSL